MACWVKYNGGLKFYFSNLETVWTGLLSIKIVLKPVYVEIWVN